MRKFLLLLMLLLPVAVSASVEIELLSADVDLHDKVSLRRGAKHFVNYCLGCHSAKYIRYLRIARDFGLENDTVLKDIAPLGASIYDTMNSAMDAHDAAKWFGTMPPDLSLIARSRGPDWLYTYLKGFYVDEKRPFGVNNWVFQDVGMPHILWQLQGLQRPVYKSMPHGGTPMIEKLELIEPGTLSPKEFDQVVNDLVNFLVYVGEPTQMERRSLGKYVLLFIIMFGVVAYLLKREYWKDVH